MSRSKLFLNKEGFDEIRAIPWVSSWVQTRYNISGWFGVGYEINQLINLGKLKVLEDLYSDSLFFKNMLDSITFEMARSRNPISKKYSKSYLNHLLKIKDPLGPMLISLHNLNYYFNLMADLGTSIDEGRLDIFREDFYK